MKRILIVDDSEDLQDTYELLLRDAGYEVHKASDGAAALRCIDQLAPDLVLLDLMMADVDGLELLARLRCARGTVSPLVLAWSGFADYRSEALRRGAKAFLMKPVDVGLLLRAIQATLEGRPLPAELLRDNALDVMSARDQAADATAELVARLPPAALRDIRPRLRALASWLQRYYAFGAAFIQILRDEQLAIEAASEAAGRAPRAAPAAWVEGRHHPRQLSYCDDVIAAAATVVLTDPQHHSIAHFREHPTLEGGLRFYAGVPLITWSGVVIGTLCLVDLQPRRLYVEDLRLMEALGLQVGHALEQLSEGMEPDALVVDAQALFAPELLTPLLQIGVQRAARSGGVVGATLVQLGSEGDVAPAARACHQAGVSSGFVAVRRGPSELALVAVGSDEMARALVARALAAIRAAVPVRSVGSGWWTPPPAWLAGAPLDSAIDVELLAAAETARRADRGDAGAAPASV